VGEPEAGTRVRRVVGKPSDGPNSDFPTVQTTVSVERHHRFDEVENADSDDVEERNDTERIVLFPDEHDDRAWEAATVAAELELEPDAVSAILSRLKERDLVRRTGPQ